MKENIKKTAAYYGAWWGVAIVVADLFWEGYKAAKTHVKNGGLKADYAAIKGLFQKKATPANAPAE